MNWSWLRHSFSGRKSISRKTRATRRWRPALDALEDRYLPSALTVTVTTTADGLTGPNGTVTLREAINMANQDPAGAVTINFAIGSGIQTISPTSSLPIVAVPVRLDATPPASFPSQKIVLNGSGLQADGLEFNAGGSVIDGDDSLAVVGFAGSGIALANTTGPGSIVESTYMGTNFSDATGLGNAAGVQVFLAPGATTAPVDTVGGTTAGSGNVISGNDIGVEVDYGAAVLQGNVIGTDQSGEVALGNSLLGVDTAQAVGITIGGTVAGATNIISANGGDGVRLNGGTDNVITGNVIGADASGAKALPNQGDGVVLVGTTVGAPTCTLGGGGNGAINLISGNVGWGVEIYGDDNVVAGNVIGTDVTGKKALSNGLGGVQSLDGEDNTIGGATAGSLNIISGNSGDGIDIDGSPNNLIVNNVIGADVTGKVALPNTNGVVVEDGATGNRIGQPGPQVNIISGNTNDGIDITGTGTSGNSAVANVIGADVTGKAALPNHTGVVIENGAMGNQIGEAGAVNIISGNAGDGALIETNSNSVQGDVIGADVTGEAALPNGGAGVEVAGSNNVIGFSYNFGTGAFTGAENIIAFNHGAGVMIDSGSGNTIVDNPIYANVSPGIVLSPGSNNGVTPPIITSVTNVGNETTVQATLSGTPNTTYLLEFFSSTSSGPGQGETSQGYALETTNASGGVSFAATTATVLQTGLFVTATATDSGADTSAFSAPVETGETAHIGVGSSANPGVFGQPITLTAVITASPAGSYSGTVTWLDGSTTLGASTVNSAGNATLTTSGLAVATHTITAVYGGNAFLQPTTSAALLETVKADATLTVVTSSLNPSSTGQPVTFTATVSAAAPGSGRPTGAVTFQDGLATLGTGLLNAAGQATFTTSTLNAGKQSIIAVYGGDANFAAGTSATLTQTVNANPSTTVLASSVDPSAFGQLVTFTATVTGSLGTPTGTVTFEDGSTTLGTGALNGSGRASFTTSTLAVRVHSITAVYSGSGTYAASTSPVLSQTVTQDASLMTVSSSANPSAFGRAVTFTVTVSASSPGSGTPTGTVTFKNGSATLAGVTLSGSQATFTTSALPVGAAAISVAYGGDANFTGSTSPTLSQTVTRDGSTTTVTSSVNPSGAGQLVTFTAAVTAASPGAGMQTGSVTFLDGSATLGTGALSALDKATFTTSVLSAGTHSIIAVYNGDANFLTSTSPTLIQTVNPDATSTRLVSSANPSTSGQSVTFAATVTANPPGGGTPTGSVTFKDGTTTLGSGSLSASGVATFTTSSLSVGSHSITAIYNATSNYSSSISPTLTQTVTSGPSALLVTAPAFLSRSTRTGAEGASTSARAATNHLVQVIPTDDAGRTLTSGDQFIPHAGLRTRTREAGTSHLGRLDEFFVELGR